MNLTRKAAPAAPLITLQDLKLHLRVDGDDDDSLIDGLFQAAMAHIDGPRGVLGRCIQRQTWSFDAAPWEGFLRLPFPGVVGAKATVLIGDDPAEVPLTLRRSGVWSEVQISGEVAGEVTVDVEAETPSDAWPAIIAAVKLMVGNWYQNRDAVVTGTITAVLPLAVDRLLSPLKVRWI